MTFKRLLGIVGALCAVAVLTGSVGAGAARTPTKHAINLSTNAGVKQYLRSRRGDSARRSELRGAELPREGLELHALDQGRADRDPCGARTRGRRNPKLLREAAATAAARQRGEVQQDHRLEPVLLGNAERNRGRLQQRAGRRDDYAVGANAERDPGRPDHADERDWLQQGAAQPEDHAVRHDGRNKRHSESDELAELQHLADVVSNERRCSVDPGRRVVDAERRSDELRGDGLAVRERRPLR